MSTPILKNWSEKLFATLYDTCAENYKGLTKNPRWLLMRKLARFKWVRDIITHLSKRSTKSYLSLINIDNSCLRNVDVDKVVQNLQTEGLYCGLYLTQEIVSEIVQFANSTVCYGNRKPELGFYYQHKQAAQITAGTNFITGNYFNTGLECPAIKKLQSDPILLAIAARYLEAQPVHQGNQMWWSFAGSSTYREQDKAAQCFHYDLDDYRFLKFFFYLTDVDEQSGPHICVRTSHKRKKSSHIWFRKKEADQDIVDYYGSESLVQICGQAGFGFAEDTFCFHKGLPPTHKDRLMLQIEFATTDYQMQHDIRAKSLLKLIVVSH